jgi:hypothetical protein
MGRDNDPHPLYLTVLVSAEKKFWRCVQCGETPYLINAEPPRPRIEAILTAGTAYLDHERAKAELKALLPGCQRGDRTWGASKAFEIRYGELRCLGDGGDPCSDLVTVGALASALAKAQAELVNPEKNW